MSFINETDFVIENKELVYPEIVTDGLQLYYDAKGKRDTDYHRDTMLDMSGNGNHGELHNFAYENFSGYRNGLIFDGIDDKLVRPDLDILEDNFTFQLNGNIISFSPDGTVKRVQDGEVIESKGFNLIRNGDFVDGIIRWNAITLADTIKITKGLVTVRAIKQHGGLSQTLSSYNKMPSTGEKYYFCANVERESSNVKLYLNDGINQTSAAGPNIGFVSNIRTIANSPTTLRIKLQDDSSASWTDSKMSNVIVINLTETFGAGNEPSKEQMDAIIDRMGFIPNTQDILDRREYTHNFLGDVEGIIDDTDKDKVSGTEIFTDKADDSIVHIEMDGKSYQHAKNDSKNLASHPENWEYSSGASYDSKTGEITIPVDEFARFWVRWDGKTAPVRLSMDTVSGGGFLLMTAYYAEDKSTRVFENSNTWVENGTAVAWGSNPTRYSVDTPSLNSNTKWIRMELIGSPQFTPSTVKIKNVALRSDSVNSYEPPAPTPDHPIEIYSLNDFDVVSQKSEGGTIDGVEVGGRNLILNTDFNGSPFRYDHVNRGEEGGLNIGSVLGFSEIPKQPYEYTISMNIRGVSERKLIVFMISSSGNRPLDFIKSFDLTENFKKVTLTFKPHKEELTNLFIYTGYSYEPYNAWFEIEPNSLKLEKGTKATDWTLAPEDITENDNHPLIDKINLLLSEPLRSVGDVKDRLFRDNDGLWKVERNVGEDILDSSNSLDNFGFESYDTDVKTNRSFRPSGAPHASDDSEARTTHFVAHEGGNIWAKSNAIGFNLNDGYQFHISFPNSLLEILSTDSKSVRDNKIREWLDSEKNKGTPLTIQYSLRTSKIETLSQDLQDKLNNLRSFQDSNYVYTVLDKTDILSDYVVDNLKPTLHARFLPSDWYKEDRVINNLMIYDRALTNEEMLQNYKTIKRRWGM